jgi:hypothetical protein
MSTRRLQPDLETGLLFDVGEAQGKPTSEEIYAALQEAAKINVAKHHKGKPPDGGDFEDFKSRIIDGAWGRMQKFRYGGRKTINEYAYKSCEFAMRDIQREQIRKLNERQQNPPPPVVYPLLDRAS